MTADESTLLMDDYQSGVTAALIDIRIARGVMSREEFAGALSIVSSTREDGRLCALPMVGRRSPGRRVRLVGTDHWRTSVAFADWTSRMIAAK